MCCGRACVCRQTISSLTDGILLFDAQVNGEVVVSGTAIEGDDEEATSEAARVQFIPDPVRVKHVLEGEQVKDLREACEVSLKSLCSHASQSVCAWQELSLTKSGNKAAPLPPPSSRPITHIHPSLSHTYACAYTHTCMCALGRVHAHTRACAYTCTIFGRLLLFIRSFLTYTSALFFGGFFFSQGVLVLRILKHVGSAGLMCICVRYFMLNGTGRV